MTQPNWRGVSSSNLREVAHDPEKNELHVRFHSGKEWTYPDVSTAEYHALLTSDSIGSHFAKHVKSKPGARPREASK